MIFFGLSKPPKRTNKSISKKPLGLASCPNCHEEGFLQAFAYSRYFHLYWIPMFPIGKRVRTECRNCETIFKGKEMPKAATVYAKELKQSAKIPFTHFSGLGVLAGLIALIIIYGINKDKRELSYIENPQVNDRYSMNLDKGYSSWKLIDTKNDTLIFHTSGMYIESVLDLDEINRYYTGDTVKYHRLEIYEMLEENVIYSIGRD